MIKRLTVSVEEAAKMLGCGRTTVYEMVRLGQLPALRLGKCGKRIRIPFKSLEEWIESATQMQPDGRKRFIK